MLAARRPPASASARSVDGEILGLAGLVGAGRTWLARRIAGLSRAEGMDVRLLDGSAVPGRSARDALERGIVYLTEDRKRDGLFAPLRDHAQRDRGVARPLHARRHRRRPPRKRAGRRGPAPAPPRRALARRADRGLERRQPAEGACSRARCWPAEVLICDEPTRGVDVGAKEEIYALLRKLAAAGVAIIVISSEFKELLALCHRLAIVRDGRIHGVVANRGLDEHLLMEMVTGAAELPTAAA